MISNEYIINRIEALCKKKGMTHYRLALNSGIAQSSVSSMMNGKSTPSVFSLEKICNGLDITLAQFFAGEEAMPDFTPMQGKLLDGFNSLSNRKKELVLAYLQGLKDAK